MRSFPNFALRKGLIIQVAPTGLHRVVTAGRLLCLENDNAFDVGPRAKLPKLSLKSLTVYGRSKSLIEITKTYAANRWLFNGIFGMLPPTKGGVTFDLKPELEAKAAWFGPFIVAKSSNVEEPDSWLLQRPGPSNPFARDFAGMVSNSDKSDLRPLALTERPISPAWSHRAQWEPVKLQAERLRTDSGDCRLSVQRQYRLVLATEWADGPIQKLLCSGSDTQRRSKACSILTGLLRLYALLLDEVALSDDAPRGL